MRFSGTMKTNEKTLIKKVVFGCKFASCAMRFTEDYVLSVYIITVIKVKLRVETFLFLLASKNSVIGNFRITEF